MKEGRFTREVLISLPLLLTTYFNEVYLFVGLSAISFFNSNYMRIEHFLNNL